MQVWSGKCCLCDVGLPSGLKDFATDEELHTGDIVVMYAVYWPDTDSESWNCCGLSAIVANQYTTYTTGVIEENPLPVQPFCMGLKSVEFQSDVWKLQLVKKHTDVIEGEHWPAYGFSYKHKGE